MNKTNRESAFPIVCESNVLEDGMTLRDYFAGQALAGYVTLANQPHCPTDELLAKYCYAAADAMLKARKEKP